MRGQEHGVSRLHLVERGRAHPGTDVFDRVADEPEAPPDGHQRAPLPDQRVIRALPQLVDHLLGPEQAERRDEPVADRPTRREARAQAERPEVAKRQVEPAKEEDCRRNQQKQSDDVQRVDPRRASLPLRERESSDAAVEQ